MDEAQDRLDHAPWPLRAVALGALGAFSGFLFHRLTGGQQTEIEAALAALVAIFGIALSFSLERLRWQWSVAFAAGGAIVASAVAWWNGSPEGWNADEGWHFASAVAAVAVALPLFQTARDERRLRLVPAAVHAHAWTNIILGAAAIAFVGATLLLTFLLSELFGLIGVEFLRDLMRKGGFVEALACAALGAAVGLLRDRDVVTSVLQRVGRTILSVLAPVLAAGLVFFVAALPFTGLDALWEQTKETTPILLACMFGALILTNAVAGNSADEEARARALRWSGMALIATMVPLALVAAISTAKRIAQHGFTPDRLWAAVFVAIAVAVALGYAWALLRGRSAWPECLRSANVRLAAGICLLALFLALPIVNFGSLSTQDQVARLESGTIAPERFDWAALRFDFGPAGRKALKRLQAHRNPLIASRANKVAGAKSRWDLQSKEQRDIASAVSVASDIRVLPAGSELPLELAALMGEGQCKASFPCTIYLLPGGREALQFDDACFTWETTTSSPRRSRRQCDPARYLLREGKWLSALEEPYSGAQQAKLARGYEDGTVEIRTVAARRVFIDGEPASEPFE
jgi:hypothetical protein